MKDTQEKMTAKEFREDSKKSFVAAVSDRKRWLTCFIELLISAAFLAVDLLTKHFIYGACKETGRINIIKGVICFEAVENTGASFGIFSGKTAALTAISIVCAVVLLFFLFYTYQRRNLWLRSALILILAGAVGNIVDRLAFGYVRDFIYFELIDFAVFNFADSCLTVGTIVLIIYVIFFYSKDEKALEEKRKASRALASPSNSETRPNESDSAKSDAQNVENGELSDEKDTFRDDDRDGE